MPAPFDPTMAIRVSRLTSKLTRFKIIFELSYPNVTSESWSRGGESFSVSGNLDDYGYEIVHIHNRLINTPEFLCFFCHWRSKFRKLHSPLIYVGRWREETLTFSRILILDCACAARLALYRHRSMNACKCLRYSICASYSRRRFRSRSDFVE